MKQYTTMSSKKRIRLPLCAPKLYERGNSISDIAKLFGLSKSSIRNRLIDANVKLRTRIEGTKNAGRKFSAIHKGRKRKPLSPEWKENIRKARLGSGRGLSYKTNSYVEITSGEHKYRRLHVVLMELAIGRRLAPNEVVHHKDHNKHNFNLCNLQLMTRSEHSKLHHPKHHGVIK